MLTKFFGKENTSELYQFIYDIIQDEVGKDLYPYLSDHNDEYTRLDIPEREEEIYGIPHTVQLTQDDSAQILKQLDDRGPIYDYIDVNSRELSDDKITIDVIITFRTELEHETPAKCIRLIKSILERGITDLENKIEAKLSKTFLESIINEEYLINIAKVTLTSNNRTRDLVPLSIIITMTIINEKFLRLGGKEYEKAKMRFITANYSK
jgi:hypothetical protein